MPMVYSDEWEMDRPSRAILAQSVDDKFSNTKQMTKMEQLMNIKLHSKQRYFS